MRSNHNSDKVTVFYGRETPESGYLVGYAWFISKFSESDIHVPLPEKLSISTDKHRRYDIGHWQVFTVRHRPDENPKAHLTFALKHEGIDLYSLKSIFQVYGPQLVIEMVHETPLGQYARRIWFLYEWLMGEELDLPALSSGTYIRILDDERYYPGPERNSTRHRVKNNLPGIPAFCPLIRRTSRLEQDIKSSYNEKIEQGIGRTDKALIKRAAAFLLIKDSKASFAIEGENPPNPRARNWGKIIGEAGTRKISIKEIERLQSIVIGHRKLKNMGIRVGVEGFIGEHDSSSFEPIPDHISAKSEDLVTLLKGLFDTYDLLKQGNYHPVLTAATIAFGFVFIHPLVDGNGRIHRYLIHHILAEIGFASPTMIFPISAAILDDIIGYKSVLESYSSPRVDLIKWETDEEYNTKILNDTIDLYKYYDLTEQAEFLFRCVEQTIIRIVPEELDYLKMYDQLFNWMQVHIPLSDSETDLMIKFLQQSNGKLSETKRKKFFGNLWDAEVLKIEKEFQKIFSINLS